jgi:NADH-quinone oxidoreductase subunit M
VNATALLVPGIVWLAVMLLFFAVPAGERLPLSRPVLAVVVLSASLAAFATRADAAYAAAAVSALTLGVAMWSHSRAGAATMLLSGAAAAAAAILFSRGHDGAWTLWLSLGALALRCGIVPVHVGIGALTRESPGLQSRQFAVLLVLVLAHLRFADHIPQASAVAPAVVRWGAGSGLLFGLLSLVQRDVRGLLTASTLMHGGLLFAAVGAAGRGHHAAALFACVTMAVAVGGLAFTVQALEARVGDVQLIRSGGRAHAFPRLTAAFAFLGAAGVGMPGTAGFIADDLLLHALWEESLFATVAVALASALLAIATLRAVSAVFFGQQRPAAAPDLLPNERRIAVAFVTLLAAIGLAPQVLTATASALFGTP